MVKIAICGAGGFAREVEQLICDINVDRFKDSLAYMGVKQYYDIIGFFDDDVTRKGEKFGGSEVVGTIDDVCKLPRDVKAVIAVGSPVGKRKIFGRLASLQQSRFENLISPFAHIGRRVTMGQGNIICAGSVLTVDIELCNFVTVNLNCTVGHDSILGDFNTLCPGVNISGGCDIRSSCFFGTNSCVIDHVNVSSGTVVGAGAVVTKAFDEGSTVVGVPARKIK